MSSKPSRSHAALAALLASALPAMPAAASQFESVSLDDLTRASEAVVRGRVVDVTSEWSDDQEALFTFATVEVTRSLSGDLALGDRVVVKEVGGVLSDFALVAPGFPAFRPGDDLVLFLTRWQDDGHYRVEGYGQGFYLVRRDARSGREVVEPGPVQDAPDQPGLATLQPVPAQTPVDDLLRQVRAVR